MADIKTEYACPTCRDNGNVKSQIIASGGNRIICSTNPAHVWTDLMEFKNLRPKMEFAVSAPAAAPQAAHTTMQVTLPMTHKTILEAKLAGNLNATVAGILSMLAEGDVMIVPSGDIQRIKQLLNETPRNSGELFGMIYALHLRETEAKSDAEQYRKELGAYEGTNRSLVVVDLGEQRDTFARQAESESLPLKLYVQKYLKNAAENNWL